MNIGLAFKKIRAEKGMRQNQVAKKAKISATYLCQLENGSAENPSKEIVDKLCTIYKVPLAIVVWMATDEKDVDSKKRSIFRELKPAIDGLISEVIKS